MPFETSTWAKPAPAESAKATPPADDVTRALPHAVGPEKSVLSSCLQDPQEYIGVAIEEKLTSGHFYLPAHAIIFSVLLEQFETGKGIELVSFIQILIDRGKLEAIGGAAALTDLYTYAPSPGAFREHAKHIRRKYIDRQMIRISNETIQDAYESPDEGEERLDKLESEIMGIREAGETLKDTTIKATLNEIVTNLQNMMAGRREAMGMATGFADLDNKILGLKPGDMFVVAARPSMGKALLMDELIKTVDGWVKNKDLKVGDEIASPTGGRSFVTGIFPQGLREVVEVEFSDGRKIECDKDHLWEVFYRDWKEPRILKTSRVCEMLRCVRYRNRLWISTTDGNYGTNSDLPIDPWVLGVLIGNGGFTTGTVRFSSNDQETVDRLGASLPEGLSLNFQTKYEYRIIGRKGHANEMMDHLRDLGIWDTKSVNKSIPEMYMLANRKARVELIQGLMDTDGNVETTGSLVYSTSSEILAIQVQQLARSLGAVCTISERLNPKYTHKGENRTGATAYRVYISHPNAKEFVTLTRKRYRVKSTRQSRLTFSAIRDTGSKEAQCISVSHPRSLYIAGKDYIVTHNTAFMMNIVEHLCMNESKGCLVFSAEMSKMKIVSRLLYSRARFNVAAVSRGYVPNKGDLQRIQRATSDIAEAEAKKLLCIDETPNISLNALRAKARRIKREWGDKLQFIGIDYLQLITCRNKQSDGSREREIAQISAGIKGLAKELGVPILILAQLNRGPESRTGKLKGIPKMSDLRESGAIEQDADQIGLLYRLAYYADNDEDRASLEGKAQFDLAKNRDGETGTVFLTWVADLTRFEHGEPYQFTFADMEVKKKGCKKGAGDRWQPGD